MNQVIQHTALRLAHDDELAYLLGDDLAPGAGLLITVKGAIYFGADPGSRDAFSPPAEVGNTGAGMGMAN